MNDENSLEINIQAVDNASETLDEVASTASDMADSVAEAAQTISDSFQQTDEQLQELADAAYSAAESWTGAMGDMTTSTGDAVAAIGDETASAGETLAENLYGPMDAAGEQMLAGLQAQGAALEEAIGQLGTMTAEAWDEQFGPLIASEMETEGETAGAAFGDSFMGTFRYLMLGYFASTFGSDIIGAVTGTVNAAAGTPDKIAQLEAQIQSEQATIQQGRAALTQWNGTTIMVAAAHDKARASIEAATVKIAQLKMELTPLMEAQQGAAGTTTAYDNAVLKLGGDWQGLQGTLGGTLLPTLTQYSVQLDTIVLGTTAWVNANPDLTQHLLELSSVLGEMIKLLGDALIGYGLFTIAVKILGPDLLALAQFFGLASAEAEVLSGGMLLIVAGAVLAIAVAVAALIVYWPQIQQFLDYWGTKTGVFELFNSLFTELANIWNSQVMPALRQLWAQLQPLMPYLQLGAEVIGGVLLAALVTVAAAIVIAAAAVLLLVAAWATFVNDLINKVKPVLDELMTWVKPFTDWLSTLPSAINTAIQGAVKYFQPIIDAVQKLITLVKQVPSGILSGIGSSAISVATSMLPGANLLSMIPALATGGIVSSPTLAMIGEAGPEAVIPLSAFNGGTSLAGAGGGGAGGNIIVNITGTFLSQDAARQLSQMMVQSLNQKLRLSAF